MNRGTLFFVSLDLSFLFCDFEFREQCFLFFLTFCFWSHFLFCSCLEHSVDALAPGADEGRCGLRYASGSWRTSFDPRVSEWGNPARVMSCYQHLNV